MHACSPAARYDIVDNHVQSHAFKNSHGIYSLELRVLTVLKGSQLLAFRQSHGQLRVACDRFHYLFFCQFSIT